THFGPGGRDDHSKLPLELEERIRANPYTKEHLDRAKKHLATQGDGNHFAFVGTSDQNGLVTLITHHGSRGFGAKVYQEGMKVAERFRQQLSPETLKQNAWIPMNTEEGRLYWEALQIVRAWTKLNHATIHRLVTVATEYRVARTIWNEHNFVFERKGFYYHGKGATPMWNHAPKDEDVQVDRIIPLNMAAPILLIRGGLKDAMEFSPHGAGRNMSRTAHAKSGVADFTRETAGLDIRSWSGKADESELPSAYKEANAIEREIAKHKLGKLSERILPYGSIMAGKSKHARRRRKR
ncbi:MAG: RtcB family protein, partial [Bacteroidota bacterium]